MGKKEINWLSLKNIVTAFLTIGAIFGSVMGVTYWIEATIDKKLSDERVLRKISSLVRPSVIFDENKSVLANLGAMELIEDIRFEGIKEGTAFPEKIIITPKAHLYTAPVLTNLDSFWIEYTVTRGELLNWEYDIHAYIGAGVGRDNWEKIKFRLEILN